jgi:hypothetical protein
LGGGVDAAQPLGQREGALGLAAVAEEAAGLPAQRVTIVPAPLFRSARSYERALSEADPSSTQPPQGCGCGRSLSLEGAPQHGGAWVG